MRLSTVSRAPEEIGANDAEAPEHGFYRAAQPPSRSVSATCRAVVSSFASDPASLACMLQSLVDRSVCAVDEHPLTITAAQAAQIPLVQRLAREIWHRYYPSIVSVAQIDYMLDRGYSDEALRRFVDERDAGLALARVAGSDVGFAAWYRNDATTSKLDKLYVLPQHHRTGIGRGLIEHVGAHAKAAGCSSLTLNVNRGNTSAIRAYERCGFTVRARGDFPIGDGFVMEDFIMVREL